MKISYNWLKEYIKTNTKPKKLGNDLSLFGHQLEKIDKVKNDYILDFDITPNRGDCLSILGMAREIAALYNINFKLKNINEIKINNNNKNITFEITDKKICPQFLAYQINNIKIKKSPKKIIEKLESYGFKSINNIVDITNYIMIETGQPLHAFDLDKLSGNKFVLQKAKNNQKIITIDGKERILDSETIIIKDKDKIFDLSGIMGGFNSEVDEKTKNIILTSAVFNPVLIRKTSKRLNMLTDASYRYERNVDCGISKYALDCAVKLIIEQDNKSNVTQFINIDNTDKNYTKIKADLKKINNLLGTNLSNTKIYELLARLNIHYTRGYFIIPSYRVSDIKIWQALAEEVIRLLGYDKLKKNYFKKCNIRLNKQFTKIQELKKMLANNGFNEIYSYSFADENYLKSLNFDLSKCVQINNSITPENKYLRPNLLVSMLDAVKKNPWAPEINIFEIGKVFQNNKEFWQIGIISTQKKSKNINEILNKLNLNLDKIIKLDEKILNKLKIRKQVTYTLINLSEINDLNYKKDNSISTKKYIKVSQFAPTVRDLAFIVSKDLNSDTIINDILNIDKSIFLVELFDEFISDKFGKNKKNLAYHIWIQDYSNPVSDNQVAKIIQKIINLIEKKYQAKLRG